MEYWAKGSSFDPLSFFFIGTIKTRTKLHNFTNPETKSNQSSPTFIKPIHPTTKRPNQATKRQNPSSKSPGKHDKNKKSGPSILASVNTVGSDDNRRRRGTVRYRKRSIYNHF